MKTYLINFLLLLGILSSISGCSSDDTDLSDLILDNNIGEKWDGVGMPSWLKERYLTFVLQETEWMVESYEAPTLCNIYKFSYMGNTLVALSYKRFSLRQSFHYESGTICYTDDGRRVKFENLKDSFEKSAILMGTNGLGGKNTPKVADYELENIDSLGWLQEAIDKVCEDIQQPDQLLCRVACGYAHNDTDTYIVLDYEYFNKENLNNGPQKVRNVYTKNGEKINIPDDLEVKEEDLRSQGITDIVAYLQAGNL